MATANLGTNTVPTAARPVELTVAEVDAVRRAAFHAFGEALRWAVDQVELSQDADDPDADQCMQTVRAFDAAGRLLDLLGWASGGTATLKPDPYVRGVVVLALDFHRHERPILKTGQFDRLVWIIGAMDDAGWPELTEDAAWSSVFERQPS
jgi:hypothetical protein